MTTRPALLVATRNPGKVHELVPMIDAAGFRALCLSDAGIMETAEEDGLEVHETFEENALAKARWFFAKASMGGDIVVLADDSGLEVDALGGAPGVRSKRYSGSRLHGRALDDENNRTLLRALGGHQTRTARFVCAAAIAWRGGELVARGETAGEIIDAPRGEHGFGYDPHFLSLDLGLTLAEATREEKERVSHRARAVRAAFSAYAAR